ncbi:archaetidylserine decarboxylase [Thaumasiovibrio subtropicus]|uniref:archaetidylserine decarboxylase n=1 Tax=Thaumasiovibrio subtropicus TaxID=1891207 RepID=UPI00186537FF|nr:archaetidylserine decarboxylase [Thaumasiovibrio subtropicus]
MDNLKITFQYLLPKHAVTRLVGKIAAWEGGGFTTTLINAFIRQYKIDMNEAAESDSRAYATFNQFFVRELKAGARPIDDGDDNLCFPADACVSQFGKIEADQLIQAKGHTFDVCELVGGNKKLAAQFTDGEFATLYLSPRDYHRVHMPCDATLRQMIYVPGDLFSVNPLTAENVPNLFARNERVVCVFDTEFGPMVQILVGATIVGSIETVWAGTVTPPTGPEIRRWDYPASGQDAIALKKGDEMGRFKLGSTVINLFPQGMMAFDNAVAINATTRMGEVYGRFLSTEDTTD